MEEREVGGEVERREIVLIFYLIRTSQKHMTCQSYELVYRLVTQCS